MQYQKKENGLFVQCQRFTVGDEIGQNMELYKISNHTGYGMLVHFI